VFFYQQAIGYKFDYDEYHSCVHGRLPYDNLKPDPVLRHLLLSLPIRKVVSLHEHCSFSFIGKVGNREFILSIQFDRIQIFTNGDKIHAAKVVSRMGLEDCFEGIICFETLNPPEDSPSSDEAEIFDILEYLSRPAANMELPKSPVLCKPSEDAMVHALKIANIDPQRTVGVRFSKHSGCQHLLFIVCNTTANNVAGQNFLCRFSSMTASETFRLARELVSIRFW